MNLASAVRILRWALPLAVVGCATTKFDWRRLGGPVVDEGPDRLSFKPNKVVPEARVFERGLGGRLPAALLQKLDKEELKRTLREAIAVRSHSCQEGEFVNYAIRKFQAIGVAAGMDGALERYASLDPKGQTELLCGEKIPPNSGNFVATIPPNNPDPEIELPPIELTFHLDTQEDPDLSVVERGGRFYSDGTTILGGDDKAGFAIVYSLAKFIVENNLPHPGITIKGLIAEERSQAGGKLLDNRLRVAPVELVFDAARTDAFATAGPDIYFGSFVVEQNNWEAAPPKPHSGRFSLAFEGSPQHPAFSHKGISAIGLATETLKRMQTGACGTVKGHDDIRASFRLLGGKLKPGTSPQRPEIIENGNEVPVAARLDFFVEGDTPQAVEDYRRRLLAAAKEVTEESTRSNEGGAVARFYAIDEVIGEAPRPYNASAMMAHALVLLDYRATNHPGGDPEIVFQVNAILSDQPGMATGGWQIRSVNPAKTEPFREQWETALAKVTGAFRGTHSLELMTGQKLLTGYRLPDDDPGTIAVLGAYRLAGLPRPRVGATFGGSTTNHEVADLGRGSVILMPNGVDFLHTERENWDIEDGYRALQIGLATILFLNQYGRRIRVVVKGTS